MAKIDIRKHKTKTTVHYEPVGRSVFSTDIARLRSLTPTGRAFLDKAPVYCRLERTLIAMLVSKRPINKKSLMAKFHLPGRVVNAAVDSAKGIVDSARACAALALQGTREAICRALTQYAAAEADPTRQGELHGRRRRLCCLVEQEARHERLVERPRIFPGGDLYRKQHKRAGQDWKNEFTSKRNDHISANGGADEEKGNKTLQITLGPTEAIDGRLWQWFEIRHSRKAFGRFRLWASECQELLSAVRADAPPVRKAPVEVWFDAAGKKIRPRQQAKMIAEGLTPPSVRSIERAVTAGRVGLTIDLHRQKAGRWYIHISRKERDLPVPYAPVAWAGVDLNCDSVAHAVVAMRDGEPMLLSYAKDSFPRSGPAGARLARLYQIIDRIVADAAARRLGISLEYLDFEYGKRWLRTKLGAMLHVMPYRQIRRIFERRCLEAGVPLRYVPPKYSSLLGAVLSAKWTVLGRDQAAGAVLALRASEEGNPWLERACEQAASAERVSLRLNAKGRFGHTLMVEASPPCPSLTGAPGRLKDRPGFPVEPALKWQVACGRKISAAFSTLADLRSASLRATRRAANAQKRSNDHTPRFKMPHRIRLDHPDAHASAQCSSLRNET